MPENDAQKPFQIGLALAGAISAGAYTAGVLDFLIQALDEWEKVRGEPGVPKHRVVLNVVAGASAGAITGALGAVALARGVRLQAFTPEEMADAYRDENLKYQKIRCVLPALYDIWVTRPRMVAEDGGIDFLSEEDLAGSGNPKQASVLSLLNAKLLDDIKRRALLADHAQPPIAQQPYSYVAEPLHVYMTVSNLRGIPFKVEFGNSSYGMQTHGDRVHYALAGLGASCGLESEWVRDDKNLLSVKTLPNGDSISDPPSEWDEYGTCALASSAFPIGLASRQIEMPMEQYHERKYPIQLNGAKINPNFPAGWSPEKFTFRNVDGGLINNNPFDYAQYALAGGTGKLPTEGSGANSAVIMIAPFPEPPTFLPDGQPRPELVNIIRALFPTLVNQARFRASELAPAMNSQDYSRFLIAPHRKLPTNDPNDSVEERYTIACGLLGGFGGFLDEKFRAHDFQLGRRNCQAFLRRTFGLPGDNRIVAPIKGEPAFEIPPDAQNPDERYPIVPLLGSAADEVPLPHWPRMSQPDLNVLLKRIEGRFKSVAPILVRAQTNSRVLRSIGYIALSRGRDRLLEYIQLTILSDLIRRDQIAGWELPRPLVERLNKRWENKDGGWNKTADDIRSVLAELASPAFNFRTAAGIAAKTLLDEKFVAEVLTQFRQVETNRPFSVWKKDGAELFTLTSRKPDGFWSLPVISALGNWLEPPTTDQSSAGRQFGG